MPRLRRILHVIGRLDGYGGARMLRWLAARQAAEGNRVAAAALETDPAVGAEFAAAGVELVPLGRRWLVDPLAIARLAWLRRKFAAEVLHAWDAESLGLTWLADRMFRGRERRLATVDSEDSRHPWWTRLAASAAQQGTEFVDVPRGVPIGVESAAPAARADLLRELGLPEGARLIGVAAPLVRRAELDEAIWCFELLRVLQHDAALVIFGDGPDRSRLERFATLTSSSGAVRFLGFRRDWPALAAGLDVVWQLGPSAATPYALLEALAAGAAVVASDCPAHRAVIVPRETGLLALRKNRAAITRATDELLENRPFARLLGRTAAERAVERNLELALTAYGSCYEPKPR